MKSKLLYMVSLGCCKNLVDSEKIIFDFTENGWQLTDEPTLADAIIVNTCGFIESAKTEAIETLLELAPSKKQGAALVATGCLAQRYPKELFSDMPELDLVVGIDKTEDIRSLVESFIANGERTLDRDIPQRAYQSGGRVYSTPGHYAYVRIADGCDNFCAFCAIPHIRGRYRSRKSSDVLREIKSLAEMGVREIIIVAQDTTRYGEDTGDITLAELFKKAVAIDGVEWIRFLYAYPESVTEELIRAIENEPKLCPYLDIPIQHCNDRILKKMNRRIDRAGLETLLARLRESKAGFTIRTTLMTGFPSETEEEHDELLEFMKKWRFDRLGAFTFSPEEGTPAYSMDCQIDEETKARRLDEIMTLQSGISEDSNSRRVGSVESVVVDSFDEDKKLVIARSQREVPDVDGLIYVQLAEDSVLPVPGMVFDARITDSDTYDLTGEPV